MNKLVGSRSGTLLPAPDSGHLGNLYNFLVTDWCTANPFHRALPVKKSKCKKVDLCYTCCKFESVRCDGREPWKYGLSQNSLKGPKLKIPQKSITTKSEHHKQPTDSANDQASKKKLDLFGSALRIYCQN